MTTRRPVEILLVDDDPVDVRLTRQVLANSKLANRVSAVGNGQEALDLLRSGAPPPDVILLDLNMPVMDGHEFLRIVKNDPELATIPIVVVTTSDEDVDIVASYQLHANAFVTKPVDLTQLSTIVRAIEDFWFEVVRLPTGG